jgi:hypothetical protein
VDKELYEKVFFVKIIEKKLDKDFNRMIFNKDIPKILYVKGDFERKTISCEGARSFLVLEKTTGLQ